MLVTLNLSPVNYQKPNICNDSNMLHRESDGRLTADYQPIVVLGVLSNDGCLERRDTLRKTWIKTMKIEAQIDIPSRLQIFLR